MGNVRVHGLGKSFIKEEGPEACLKECEVGLGIEKEHSSGEEELQGKSKGKGIGIAQEGDEPTVKTVPEGG